MTPLMEVPWSHQQYREIVELLAANDISVHVKTNYFSANLIWVEDSDFAKAREIAQAAVARFAADSKKNAAQDRKNIYHDSYFSWLKIQFRRPGWWFKVILLLATGGVFLYYPLFYIFRFLFT